MYLCKLNLADVYLNLNQLDLSDKCLDEVEDYMRKNGDETAIYYCNTIRIGQAVKKKDWNTVARILAGENRMISWTSRSSRFVISIWENIMRLRATIVKLIRI